jgi:hypothetical protein
MSSPNLELVKRQYPALAPLLDQLASYISDQTKAGQTFILPKLAAAAMGLNDGEAYVLLELLANSEVLSRAFNVYCKETGVLLATIANADDLDSIPYCDFCDCRHAPNELKLEIAFQPLAKNNDRLRAA